MRFGRLPNKYGTITKLSGKRRKPFCAKIYVGTEADDEARTLKYKYKVVGTYETRSEALRALSSANEHREELLKRGYTFAELFDDFMRVKESEAGKGRIDILNRTFSRLPELHNKIAKDITADLIEKTIVSNCETDTARKNAIELCRAVLDYGMKRKGAVSVNVAQAAKVNFATETKIKREPWTEDEIKALWKKQGEWLADIILIQLYSGFRIAEVSGLRTDHIDFDRMTISGNGVKTRAGKTRTVPIHPDIVSILRYRSASAEDGYLFRNDAVFLANKVREKTPHKSHDARVTFVTQWKRLHLDDRHLKIIIGHAAKDITEVVYTKIPIEDLKESMRQFHY